MKHHGSRIRALQAFLGLLFLILAPGTTLAGKIVLDRPGWAWGAHLGLGTGQIEDGNENQPRRFGASAGLWAGYGLSQYWVLRGDLRVWKRVSAGHKMLMAEPVAGFAFYPNGESLFFQGGVGAGYASLDAWDLGTTQVGAWGPDFFMGVGYEFPLSPTGAISVHMDASYTHLGRLGASEVKLRKVGVNYTDLVLTYSWY